jgi:hypothetical protein
LTDAPARNLWHNGGMKRNELIGAIALLAVCILVGWFLWTNDPAHRTAVRSTPAAPPTVRADTVLTTLPGLEERAADTPAVVICRPQAGERVAIRRGQRLADGALYLDVKVSPNCYGWVHVGNLVGVSPETINRY